MAEKTNMTMGMEFLDRSLRTTSILLLIFLPFGIYYFGLYPTLSVFSGGVWGVLNLISIAQLVLAMLRPNGADWKFALLLGLFKFPLLYASLYFLVRVEVFDPIFLLAGVSTTYVVIMLKGVARALLKLDTPQQSGAERPATMVS